MNAQQLKEFILNDTLSDDFLILVCEDNFYIAKQYAEEIASRKNLCLNIIDSLSELDLGAVADLFAETSESRLNILLTDTFNEKYNNYYDYYNTIVICSKIDKQIAKQVEPFTVKIPKAPDWAIKEYIKTYCEGLTDLRIDDLYNLTNGDIYRITNELDKIKLFDKNNRDNILAELLNDPYVDFCNTTIFDIKNYILQKNKSALCEYLKHKNYAEIDPISITNLLLADYKKNLLLRFNKGTTAESLGLSKGAAYYAKTGCNLSEAELQDKINFLSKIDYKLKSGELDIPKELITTYILSHILS